MNQKTNLSQANSIDLQFISKLHAKRLKLGFCDDISITEKIVEANISKNLPKKRFLRAVLTDTLHTTQAPEPHLLENSRHYLLDIYVLSHLQNETVRFLDLGCGIAGGFSPTTVDTLRLLSRYGISAKAIAVDKKVSDSMDNKIIDGILYLNLDIFSPKLVELGKFDYIRCMNVLYYFNSKIVNEALETFKKMLLPGGVLAEDSFTQKRKTVVRLHQKIHDSTSIIFEGDIYDER